MSQNFQASLSRSQGRKSWCVIFRHPMRLDKNGKPGLRVRKGLGTINQEEANALVDQLNKILSDESFWKLSAKEIAARQFDNRIVEAFYEFIETKIEDSWLVREKIIPLPGCEQGYSCVQLVGATGSGKTTLLRQIIGTDPKKERFPSISTAKTTTFDIEIIMAPGKYRCVVSFLSQDLVRFYIEECVAAAILSFIERKNKSEVVKRLLEHSEQRFRLSYLLGTLSIQDVVEDEEDFISNDDDDDDLELDGVEDKKCEIDDSERIEMEGKLKNFIERIFEISDNLRNDVASCLEIDPNNLSEIDHDTFLELIEDEICKDVDSQNLIDDILNEVESKFNLLKEGNFDYDRTEWPRLWTYETDDRHTFLNIINLFSSNYAPNFGKLYAPVVQGLRVIGPFRPSWISEDNEIPSLVLIDGEGLGHTPSSSNSLPTSITTRFKMADVILLVDNATQPMQAAAQSVLRNVTSGGHDAKIAIAFTHFDQVKGDNLPNMQARKDHVSASLENAIRALEQSLGSVASGRLKRRLHDRVFFVSKIQEIIMHENNTKKSFKTLLEIFKNAITLPEISEVVPIYDSANLVLCLRLATEQFHEYWNAKLGLTYKSGLSKEHWTRIKALSRRFAIQWEDQYGNLRPVADLIALLLEKLAIFIDTPREWKPLNPSDEMRDFAIRRIAQEMSSGLHILIKNSLYHDQVNSWGIAYGYRGTGSTEARARDIRNIYETVAPIPGITPSKDSNKFLDIVRDIFRKAVETAGGKII